MKWLLSFCLLLWVQSIQAQHIAETPDVESIKQRSVTVKNSAAAIRDLQTVHYGSWTDLPISSIHPTVDSLLTPTIKEELLQQINARHAQLGKDTLLTADLFYIMRPYIDWLHEVDPHYRIGARIPIDARVYKTKREFMKTRRGLGVNLLCVQDTLIVNTSVNPLFRKGDMIVAINGINASELLEFNYHDRYTTPEVLLQNYYFQHLPKDYTVQLLRNDELMTITTEGLRLQKAASSLAIEESMDKNIRIYESAQTGYIALPKFSYFYNPRIIKTLQSQIAKFKAKNCKYVILDLRYNTGGSGYMFDKLLSLFINRPTIPYLKSQKLRVSPYTIEDYEFITEEMIGQTITLPDSCVVKRIDLDPKLYIGDDIDIYVLMSRNTSSIAASFCNILQYNGAATLVGEPLCHNALRYGETVTGEIWLSSLLYEASIATTEYEEHSLAVDGVLMPDITIPYAAEDYISGQDAMLDQVLEIIKQSTI
ncbi:MAG: hypothetical protein J6C56_05850 [Alistipes sp.]|nr:hypothetical protein [Alistipes sp.]